jgi:glycosyltransferase involved in cell wall biosynthesis
LSKTDVVLLNSDTVVTEGWLKKILDCAYSRPEIANVSPFTNSGVLCSLPYVGGENAVPQDFTVDEYAKLVETVSGKDYLVLPSVFGFCMLIKRSVINEIGPLDEIYGKGYFEENDFSCRARMAGYDNALCDDTYIYHKGSVSFNEDKYGISRKNEKIILSRYPDIISEVQKYMENEALAKIHLNIILHTMLWSANQSTVFFMLHKSPFDDASHARGGVEYHVLDIINSLENVNYFAFFPATEEPFVSAYKLSGKVNGQSVEMEFPLVNPIYKNQYESKEVRSLLEQILKGLRISCVHIQHLLGNTLDIVEICNEQGIPCYLTLHDFYALCPNYTCLNFEGVYCGAVEEKSVCKPEICRGGSGEAFGVARHREKMQDVLPRFDRIFVPSKFLKGVMEKWYANISCDVAEHWYPVPKIKQEVLLAHESNEKKALNVAFLGAVSKIKGSEYLMDLFDLSIQDINWHVFGAIGDEKILGFEGQSNVFFHGSYKREEIVEKLKKSRIDIVCLLSQVPETYGYTLTEAWMAGCPVICMDYGAVAQRVKEKGAGWILKKGAKASDIFGILEKIIGSPDMLAEAGERIPIYNDEEMQKRLLIYGELYQRKIWEDKVFPAAYDPHVLTDAWISFGEKNMILGKSTDNKTTGLLISTLYLDKGKDFNEDDCIRTKIPLNKDFDVRFDLNDMCCCRAVRFDITEGYKCYVMMKEATVMYADGTAEHLKNETHNGLETNDWVIFDHNDPYFLWSVEQKPIKYVRFKGEWHIYIDRDLYQQDNEGMVFDVKPNKIMSSAYYDSSHGYNEKEKLKTIIPMTDFGTEVFVEVNHPVRSIRWDPMEIKGCLVRINSVRVRAPLGRWYDVLPSGLAHNGIKKGEWILFETPDPWIEFKDPDGKLIQGVMLTVNIGRIIRLKKTFKQKAKAALRRLKNS